jgi:hypothetical protein
MSLKKRRPFSTGSSTGSNRNPQEKRESLAALPETIRFKTGLEDELERQLDLTTTEAIRLNERSGGDVKRRTVDEQVRMVEGVEEFRAELKVVAFREEELLVDAEVIDAKSRTCKL